MKEQAAAKEHGGGTESDAEVLQSEAAGKDNLGLRYSIIVTCYNQHQFIKDAVESALSQGHPSKEVIVVDDGSQDGSLEILKRYEPSIQLISFSANRGAIAARNRGVTAARGEYLIFLDGDDLLTPWALDLYEQVITERHPTIIVSAVRWFSDSVPVLRWEDGPQRLEFVEYESLMARERRHGWQAGIFVFSRRAIQDVDGWTPGIFQMDTMDLAAKLGYSGSTVLVCSTYTLLYRVHGTNSVHFIPPFLRSAHLMIGKERGGEYPGGPGKRFERFAFHGAMLFFWVMKGLGAGYYSASLWLALRGWPMILAAVIRKFVVRLRGRRPVEVRQFTSLQMEVALPRGSHE
jgi:glycosyltransferase involved in cell wall biosynthesis